MLLTVAGAMVHPALLGTGNALFHVGGGVGCIREDDARNRKGVGLGVFVAPGALGLYAGTLLAKRGAWEPWYIGTSMVMALLCAAAGGIWELQKSGRAEAGAGRGAGIGPDSVFPGDIALLAGICLLVVVLRSYIGMAVRFPWKTGIGPGILAVLAVAGGKAAGGLCAAGCGAKRTVAVSLSLAGVCYLFSAAALPGLAALFLFNMTMPITLYWLVRSMPGMPGFAFGLLTFGLFLGFLPGYFGLVPASDGGILGCVGSGLSLALLLCAERRRGWGFIC